MNPPKRRIFCGWNSNFTPTLHKYFYLFMAGIGKAVSFTATMLDAGYLMLDLLEFPTIEIENIQYPETSIQDHLILPMTCIAMTNFKKHFSKLKNYLYAWDSSNPT
jgi:hypothetical protein